MKQKCPQNNTFTICDALIHSIDIVGTYCRLGMFQVPVPGYVQTKTPVLVEFTFCVCVCGRGGWV